jgi:hypothetical protein
MRYTKRVICGRKVLSAWNESKINLSVPEDQSATEFYELIFDAEDPYYFDEHDAHVMAEKLCGHVIDK